MDIFETKVFKKAVKQFGETKAKEYLTKTEQELRDIIATNSVHIHESKIKTELNSNYKKACEIKSDFDKALREDISPLQTAISLAATLIKNRKEKDNGNK